MFETNYASIIEGFTKINPVQYGKTRNFIDGSVTYLSPYISRGVISTKQVLHYLLQNDFGMHNAEKLIQELAWRDYWQQVWVNKRDQINSDIKSEQKNVNNHKVPQAILKGTTGIEAIDQAIHHFHKTGYIHNHIRMYIASISCNIANSHWLQPAKWMYYHLLDGDWASNALSWQWVAGTNSNKKYYANQENINKYCYTEQINTFLDVPYSNFENLEIPTELVKTDQVQLHTKLPKNSAIHIHSDLPTLIYNYYNLDPKWKSKIKANHILLLEPSVFEKYPISNKNLNFMLSLSQNIEGIQIYTGEFQELLDEYRISDIYFKEHPLNYHYKGNEDAREWMFDVKGYYPSFFAFWKQCKKEFKTKIA
ncbi:MAG: deoxyribodipyrimidine photolyase [Bacteroidia bacterium]|nr:deoxyribodipyrimidine photolyase [Bacteroidia bacterium]NNC86040.1 deoxyribodipyrimidine photolyase [Bacteroidia bacterium]NNM16801.1 deoxyribodipyrimidine photolyase [Bacteroidia bacterium]